MKKLILITLLLAACGNTSNKDNNAAPADIIDEAQATQPPQTDDVNEKQGSLSKESIKNVIQANIAPIRHCYERELAKNLELKGRVSIRFIISEEGPVSMSAIESSTINNTEVENCVAQVVRRFTFPKPSGGIVIVTYPFLFDSNDNNKTTKNSPHEATCTLDEDCVPATCCHPSECVHKSMAPDCTDMMCTMDCRPGTMDCGQGYCKCEDKKCIAVIEQENLTE